MAATKTVDSKCTTLKVDNQELIGKNQSFQDFTITGDGADTSYNLATDLKRVDNMTWLSLDKTAPFTGAITSPLIIGDVLAGNVTVYSWVNAAGTALAIASGKKVRIRLWGVV